MKKTRIPSPARSQVATTPRRIRTRGSRSLGSPARSNGSGRLSTLVQQAKDEKMDSFALSPLNVGSFLSDNTDIGEPKRQSWWKKLDDESRDLMEVLSQEPAPEEHHHVIEELDVEVLSQEKQNFTLDLPDSSDSESIGSIVIPQRKLFTQKENLPQTKTYGKIIGPRESLAKLNKTKIEIQSNAGPKKLFGQAQSQKSLKSLFPSNLLNKTNQISPNKTLANNDPENVAPKKLFGQASSKVKTLFTSDLVDKSPTKPAEEEINVPTTSLFPKTAKTKTAFPAALLGLSPNKTASNKTREANKTIEAEKRTLFGNRAGGKRKNMFADFIVSESEDEPEIIAQRNRVFGNKTDLIRRGSDIMTDTEMDDWNILPSSTMMEDMPHSPIKKPKLSNIFSRIVDKDDGEEILCQDNNLVQDNETNGEVEQRAEKYVDNSNEDVDKRQDHDELDEKEVDNEVIEHHEEMEVNEESIEHEEVINQSTDQQENLKTHSASKQANAKNKSTKETETSLVKNKTGENLETQNSTIHIKLKDKSLKELTMRTQLEENGDHTTVHTKKGLAENENENFAEQDINTTEANKVNYQSDEVNESMDRAQVERNDHKQSEQVDDNVDNDEDNEQLHLTYEEDEQLQQPDKENKVRVNESAEKEQLEESVREENMAIEEDGEVEESEKEEEIEEADEEVEESKEDEVEESEKEEEVEESKDDEEMELSKEQHEEMQESLELNEEAQKSIEQNEEVEVPIEQSEKAEESIEHIEEVDVSIEQNEEAQVSIKHNEEVQVSVKQNEEAQESTEHNEEVEESVEQNEEAQESTEHNEEVEVSVEQNEEAQESIEHDEEVEVSIEQNEKAEESIDHNEEVEVSIEGNEEAEESLEEDDEFQQVKESDEDDQNQESEAEQSQDQLEATESDNEENQASENEIDESPNVTHDTTGRHRNKLPESSVKSPEAIRHEMLLGQKSTESFEGKGRNTSFSKTKPATMHISPSLRESVGSINDGTKNSSAEGSGWDSHRITKKTLRQTFGKDFTPRKSLRALVMEKSAKRQTLANEVTNAVSMKIPQANSTEINDVNDEISVPNDFDEANVTEESDHELSRRTRQTTLEMYLQKIKKDNRERNQKIAEAVQESLKGPQKDWLSQYNISSKAVRKAKPTISKPKQRVKPSAVPLGVLSEEARKELEYKPPKRYMPRNASWITKRLYKFLETQLEPRYDYKARIRAESLVQKLHDFTKYIRRFDAAPLDAVSEIKVELARLHIVNTHFEFYEFVKTFFPREIRIKVVPDICNNLPLPRDGVFSNILPDNTQRG